MEHPLGILLAPIDDPLASLSPDGNGIAFSFEGGIAIYDLSYGTTSFLQNLGKDNYKPKWSPNGNMLAYTFEDPPFASSIYLVSLVSGETMRITNSETVERDATWSTDGKWIAFASDWAKIDLPGGTFVGVTELYLLDASCLAEPITCVRGMRQITDMGPEGDSGHPAWSPDSRLLAFACGNVVNGDYQTDICVTDINGSDLRNLTNTPEDEYRPGWSPDGSYIAFTCENPDTREGDVCVIPAVGGKVINITNTPDEAEIFSFWLAIK
jgi:TolB protein